MHLQLGHFCRGLSVAVSAQNNVVSEQGEYGLIGVFTELLHQTLREVVDEEEEEQWAVAVALDDSPIGARYPVNSLDKMEKQRTSLRISLRESLQESQMTLQMIPNKKIQKKGLVNSQETGGKEEEAVNGKAVFLRTIVEESARVTKEEGELTSEKENGSNDETKCRELKVD